MSFVVSGYDNNKSVKIICNEKLSNEELHRLLARYGDVEKIVSEEQHRIVYFSSPEEAKKCVEDSDNLQSLLRYVAVLLKTSITSSVAMFFQSSQYL